MTIAARSTVAGTRSVEEDLLDLEAGAQVVGELAVGHQAGEVDEPLDPGVLARGGDPLGGLAVLGDEVAGLHRVHQVDDRVHALDAGADQALVLDVEGRGVTPSAQA